MNWLLRRLNVRDQTIRDYREADGRIWLSVCGWVGLLVHFRQDLRVSCLAGPYGILPQWVTTLRLWQRADQNEGPSSQSGHSAQRVSGVASGSSPGGTGICRTSGMQGDFQWGTDLPVHHTGDSADRVGPAEGRAGRSTGHSQATSGWAPTAAGNLKLEGTERRVRGTVAWRQLHAESVRPGPQGASCCSASSLASWVAVCLPSPVLSNVSHWLGHSTGSAYGGRGGGVCGVPDRGWRRRREAWEANREDVGDWLRPQRLWSEATGTRRGPGIWADTPPAARERELWQGV